MTFSLFSNDFVHLDIKPANILVKRDRYKLADFGLALHTTNRKFNGNVDEGDSRYMARELLDWGTPADLTKCDIFSLGISGKPFICSATVYLYQSSSYILAVHSNQMAQIGITFVMESFLFLPVLPKNYFLSSLS